MNSRASYVVTAAVLGVLQLILTLAFGSAQSSAHNIAGYVIDVLLLVLMFLCGRWSKRRHARPLWDGALVGASFGFVSGLTAFFVTMSASSFQGTTLSPAYVANLVRYENSFAAHIITLIVSVLLFGIIGLIVGLIGGSTTRAQEQSGAM